MENFARVHNIHPPKFDSRKSNVRTFFSKFDKHKNVFQPQWEDDVAINILATCLVDANSLAFFDSLDEHVREDYDLLREHFIDHYDTPNPLTTQWHDLTKRNQGEDEAVTQYYDDLIKMGQRMDIEGESLVYLHKWIVS